MTPDEIVTRLLALAEDGAAQPLDPYDALAAEGVELRAADLAFKFTQIAAGRMFLHGLAIAFSDDYFCFDAHGAVLESGHLSTNPYFLAANQRLAVTGLQVFERFAITAAEVQTVSRAMDQGSRPQDLQTGPSALFLEKPTEAALSLVRELLTRHLRTAGRPP